jgi:hypothetical protein
VPGYLRARGGPVTAPLDLGKLVARSRGHGRAPGVSRLRRVVCRFDKLDIARIDALRRHFPGASRAALVRAFCLLGAGIAEEHVKATTPLAEGHAP